MNLRDMLRRAAAEAGSKTFTIADSGKKTYKQFLKESESFASGLTSFGVKKGDRVAILLNNSSEFLVSYFGAVLIGAEAVPLNTFLSIEEIVYILNDCSAKILVTSPDFNAVLRDFSINRVHSLEKVIAADSLVPAISRIAYTLYWYPDSLISPQFLLVMEIPWH